MIASSLSISCMALNSATNLMHRSESIGEHPLARTLAKNILRSSDPALCLHEVIVVAFETVVILLSALFAFTLATLWNNGYYGTTAIVIVFLALVILTLAVFAPIRSHVIFSFWILWWLSVLLQVIPAMHEVDGLMHPPSLVWLALLTRVIACITLLVLTTIDVRIREFANG